MLEIQHADPNHLKVLWVEVYSNLKLKSMWRNAGREGRPIITETPPLSYLQELPYAKIIDFCVESDVSSIKMSKKPGVYNMQLFLELWFYSTIKVHYLTY